MQIGKTPLTGVKILPPNRFGDAFGFFSESRNKTLLRANCPNNYGSFHFPEKLVPVVILNARAGRPLPIYCDGSNIRDELGWRPSVTVEEGLEKTVQWYLDKRRRRWRRLTG